MQLTVDRDELVKALGRVSAIIERRNTIPILSNVKLTANGALEIVATDLERQVSDSVAAGISKTGSTTVSGLTLYDIARKLPAGDVDLRRKDNRVAISAGRARFALQSLPAEDFPDLDAATGKEWTFEVPASDLAVMLDKVSFAISTEETRYYLNGIFLHEVGERLRAVATDGHRLAWYELDRPDGAAGMPGRIIPRKTVERLAKLVAGADGPVDITVSEARMSFGIGTTRLVSKLIDASFPEYMRVVPAVDGTCMTVHAGEFAACVDRVATIQTERGRGVRLSVRQGMLAASMQSAAGDAADDEIAVQYDGQPIEMGFNSRYLMDIAGQIEGECAVHLTNPSAPAKILDTGNDRALYVIMPMRV